MNGNIVPHPAQARDWQKRKENWMLAVIADPNLNPAAVRVAGVLRDMFNAQTGDAWPSQETLAKRIGMAERSVRRGLDRLVKQGHLIQLKRFGRNGTRRYAMASTGQHCPIDKPIDRTTLTTSTGQDCPHRPDNTVLIDRTTLSDKPQREPHKEPQSERDARALIASLDDWFPLDDDIEGLINTMTGQWPKDRAGFPKLNAELSKFKDWHKANGKSPADNDAAFRNWLRRCNDFPSNQNRNSRHAG